MYAANAGGEGAVADARPPPFTSPTLARDPPCMYTSSVAPNSMSQSAAILDGSSLAAAAAAAATSSGALVAVVQHPPPVYMQPSAYQNRTGASHSDGAFGM